MAGVENLVPLNQRTKDEQREIQKKGGAESGRARREQRTMRDTAKFILGLKPDVPDAAIKKMAQLGVMDEELTMMFLSVYKQQEKALKGDLPALQFLRDTSGEKPADTMALSHEMGGDFVIEIKAQKDDAEDTD
jgi:hypothetical protein